MNLKKWFKVFKLRSQFIISKLRECVLYASLNRFNKITDKLNTFFNTLNINNWYQVIAVFKKFNYFANSHKLSNLTILNKNLNKFYFNVIKIKIKTLKRAFIKYLLIRNKVNSVLTNNFTLKSNLINSNGGLSNSTALSIYYNIFFKRRKIISLIYDIFNKNIYMLKYIKILKILNKKSIENLSFIYNFLLIIKSLMIQRSFIYKIYLNFSLLKTCVFKKFHRILHLHNFLNRLGKYFKSTKRKHVFFIKKKLSKFIKKSLSKKKKPLKKKKKPLKKKLKNYKKNNYILKNL